MAQATAPILDSTEADNPECPQFGRYRGVSGHDADGPIRSRMAQGRHVAVRLVLKSALGGEQALRLQFLKDVFFARRRLYHRDRLIFVILICGG